MNDHCCFMLKAVAKEVDHKWRAPQDDVQPR